MPVDAVPKVVATQIAADGARPATAVPAANPAPAPAADSRAASSSFRGEVLGVQKPLPVDLDVVEVGVEGFRGVGDAVHQLLDQFDHVGRTFALTQQGQAPVRHRGERAVVVGDGDVVGVRLFGGQLRDSAPGSLPDGADLPGELRGRGSRGLAEAVDRPPDALLGFADVEFDSADIELFCHRVLQDHCGSTM